MYIGELQDSGHETLSSAEKLKLLLTQAAHPYPPRENKCLQHDPFCVSNNTSPRVCSPILSYSIQCPSPSTFLLV